MEGLVESVYKQGYDRTKKLLEKNNQEDLGMFMKGDISGINNPYYLKGAIKAIIDYLIKEKKGS